MVRVLALLAAALVLCSLVPLAEKVSAPPPEKATDAGAKAAPEKEAKIAGPLPRESDWLDRERGSDFFYGGGGGAYGGGAYGAGALGAAGAAGAAGAYGAGAYGGYGGGAYGGGAYGLGGRDYSGGYGGGLPEKRDPSEDDCSRVEAKGVKLAEVLREAASLIGDAPASDVAPEVKQLISFFLAVKQRKFLLAYCPQAVVLATLMHAEADTGASLVKPLEEMLETAAAVQRSYRVPPKWTGQPWESILQAGQQRAGVVLFPTGEQQFKVEHIASREWIIHTQHRCRGRRDLGNLQATPLATCLEKCARHPLCKSATFWHWQPGGYGFEQRCFLSSTCTGELATAEGAEGAVLFEKRDVSTPQEKTTMKRTIVGHGTLPWAPRCGHRLVRSEAPTRLWLLGGVGVDSSNKSDTEKPSADPTVAKNGEATKKDATGSMAEAKAGADEVSRRHRPPVKKSNVSNVIEAYLSRHVELSGELPPLRSLPYARLGDVWSSQDLGASWNLVTASAPWGGRTFFGAASIRGGRALLVLGGVRDSATASEGQGQYLSDVWWLDLASGDATVWQELAPATWDARSGFQALIRNIHQGTDKEVEEVVVLGGRNANGTLLNDVWSAPVLAVGEPLGAWRQLTPAAAWVQRADFAAATRGGAHLWILGGCDQEGSALMDVWHSADGVEWLQAIAAAPWGPRVGAAAVVVPLTGSNESGAIVVYGGYVYPDSDFASVPAGASDVAPVWSSAVWASNDGVNWQPVNATQLSWTPSTMHAGLVDAPCTQQSSNDAIPSSCAYVAGGLTHEGYFDNSVYRLTIPAVLDPALNVVTEFNAKSDADVDLDPQPASEGVDYVILSVGAVSLVIIVSLFYVSSSSAGLTPAIRRVLGLHTGVSFLSIALSVYLTVTVVQISRDLHQVQTQPQQWQLESGFVSRLWRALGLDKTSDRWAHVETLLRLAARESQMGYGGFGGGYGGSSRSSGGGYGGYGGYERDYGGGYGGYGGGGYGGYGGYGGVSMASPYGDRGAEEGAELLKGSEEDPAAKHARELSSLPTTQGLSCRVPRCDRNSTGCTHLAERSLATPYGCCSDYMLLMLKDITEWLDQQQIPYFITYGTLLGAVRENDIIPYTQDMDIVVDRSYWYKLFQGLEAAEFFGGRRYLFGVDQWEERVARACADWEGFAPSTVGGGDADRFTRGADFHLDVYASDWWQIKDLHLMDCVEPLGSKTESIRGINFSAPARPRACLEKLYGAEWRTPKRGLSGVN